MKLKDKLNIKFKDEVLDEMIFLASTKTQHLFSKVENIVKPDEKAVLWAGDIGTTAFIPIKKKHKFIKISESMWELDVEPIDKGDL